MEIGMPLRMSLDTAKLPERARLESRNERAKRSYSPEAFTASEKLLKERERCVASMQRVEVAEKLYLARSARRAGKVEDEADAYLGIAVSFDNAKLYEEAIKYYKKHLAVGDSVVSSNLLGVDCMLLGRWNKAIEAHSVCLKGDKEQVFIAHTNLGLCRGKLGQAKQAARHHQDALRIAIELQSTRGQSLAVGNLGELAFDNKDYETARACLDQHLDLSESCEEEEEETMISDKVHALILIGQLELARKKFDACLESLERAGELAKSSEFGGLQKRVSVWIGRARGEMKKREYVQNLLLR